MKLNELQKIAPSLITAGHSVHLLSSPGLGKSETVRAIAEDNDMACVEFHLTSVDSPDLRGFMIPQKEEKDGKLLLHSRFTQSPIIEAVKATGRDRGILFLDERAQASLDVQKACAPLILEGRIGESELPEGWVVWSASNRAKDRAGVNNEPMHLINREVRFDIEPDVEALTTWALEHKIHHLFSGFFNFKPALVFSDSVPSEPKPFCTPRSIVRLHDFMMKYTGGHIHADLGKDMLLTKVAAGYIGRGASAELMNYFSVESELPTIDEIVADPEGVKVPKKPDVCFACVQMLAAHVTEDNVDPVFAFMQRLPKEFQAATVRAVLNSSANKLALTTQFSEWVQKNSAMLAGSFV